MTLSMNSKLNGKETNSLQTTAEGRPITSDEAALAGMLTKTWGCRMFEYFWRLMRDVVLSPAIKNGAAGDDVSIVIELR